MGKTLIAYKHFHHTVVVMILSLCVSVLYTYFLCWIECGSIYPVWTTKTNGDDETSYLCNLQSGSNCFQTLPFVQSFRASFAVNFMKLSCQGVLCITCQVLDATNKSLIYFYEISVLLLIYSQKNTKMNTKLCLYCSADILATI